MNERSRELIETAESLFDHAISNRGGALYSDASGQCPALIVSDESGGVFTGGRVRREREATVLILKRDHPTRPAPGSRASLSGWACVVSEAGSGYQLHAWRVALRDA